MLLVMANGNHNEIFCYLVIYQNNIHEINANVTQTKKRGLRSEIRTVYILICFFSSSLFSGELQQKVSVAHDRLRRRLPMFALP